MKDVQVNDIHIVRDFCNLKVDTSQKDACIYLTPMSSTGIVTIERISDDDNPITLVTKGCKIDSNYDIKVLDPKMKMVTLKASNKNWKIVPTSQS